VPFYGLAVLCLDDTNIREILPRVKKRYMTYGLSSQADIRATHVRHEGFITTFVAHYKGYRLGEISFPMPGAHNVLNAMACIAVALELDIPFTAIQEGFAAFGGVGRRFTVKGEPKGVMVVDDYGHHPAEIKATLAAARQGWPERRIVAAFQPHRYSRTHELFSEFVTAFYDADVLILTDVYAAGEQPIEGANAERLSQEIRRHGQKDVTYIADRELIPEHLAGIVKEGDIVITLGAGSIWQQADALVKRLEG
jgi:UDP-N-acetylmuramate--alanine ligase